jgi:hypothetical protein
MINLTKFLNDYTLANSNNGILNYHGSVNFERRRVPRLQIYFECEGGFVNLQLKYRVNTEELAPERKQEILNVVEKSGVFDIQPDTIAPEGYGSPDAVLYKLSLTDGRKKQSLVCNDVTAAPAVRPLLALLRKLALDQNRG